MNKRIVFSVIAGVVVFIAVARLSGPAHCVDGWMSSSIGHRGACSHHGGVSDNPLDLLLGIIGAGNRMVVHGAPVADLLTQFQDLGSARAVGSERDQRNGPNRNELRAR